MKEKERKDKFSVLIYTQATWERPGISPRDEFNSLMQHPGSCKVLWWKTLEISLGSPWGSLMIYDAYWDMTAASQVTIVKPIMPHQKGWTPLGLCVSMRGSFHIWASCVGEDIGKIKSTISPHRILLTSLLICLKTSLLLNKGLFVMVILCCTCPLHLGHFLAHHQQSTATASANGQLFEPLNFNILVSHSSVPKFIRSF